MFVGLEARCDVSIYLCMVESLIERTICMQGNQCLVVVFYIKCEKEKRSRLIDNSGDYVMIKHRM